MAEVGNLLGLITDEETRLRLIAQMEQMFDAAEDEEKLIEQIGSPTKVAVALIRYADKKRDEASAQSESVQVPESPVTEMMEEAEANADAPDEDVIPELAFEETPAPVVESEVAELLLPTEAPAAAEIPAEPAEEVAEPAAEIVEPAAEFVEVTAEPAAEAAVPVEEFVEVAAEPAEPVEDAAEVSAPVVDEALARAVESEAAQAFAEVPAGEETPAAEPAPADAPADPAADLVEEIFAKPEAEAEDADLTETETRTVGWKAFLYFLIPGLVPGLPVFLVLFALSLVFLVIGVAAIGAAVSVFLSAFIGFNVVADMLLLIGAGTSLFAVALVLMWFAIWFLTRVCFGWVRLMHRGGVRFSRKEVPVE